MGNLCCSDKEGELKYSVDAVNPFIGKIRLKISRSFLKDNGIYECPRTFKISLPSIPSSPSNNSKLKEKSNKSIHLLKASHKGKDKDLITYHLT